jgi:phospholipid/cholesterol/gamma-HCH transport system ATP-binding protein
MDGPRLHSHAHNGAGYPIEAVDIRTQFGTNVVHDNLNLRVNRGEILGIVGGSGSGKSVLMNTLLGLRKPQLGSVSIFGKPRESLNEEEKSALNRQLGVLFQGGALFSSLTVRENVMVPMRKHTKLPVPLMRELADMKLHLAGLPPHAATLFPADLSGGMIKRAALARALALDPQLLFLDEPTAGLDPVGAAAFDQLILKLRAALGLTVIMITHDLDSLFTICDRVAVLLDKRIAIADSLPNVMAYPHPWIKEYFHGPRGRAAMASQRNRAQTEQG